MRFFSDKFAHGQGVERFRINKIDIDGYKDLNADIEIKDMTLIAGMNGTGKSVSQKILWYIHHISSIYCHLLMVDPDNIDKNIQEYTKETIDSVFDSEKFEMNVSLDTDIYSICFDVKEGKINFFDISIHDPAKFNLEHLSTPVYASQKTRLFKAYDEYIKIRKLLEISDYCTIEDIKKLKEYYKLFDILNLEGLRLKCILFERKNTPLDLSAIAEQFELKGVQNYNRLTVKRSIPRVDNGTERKKLSSLSDGEQAVLMQSIFLPHSEIKSPL